MKAMGKEEKIRHLEARNEVLHAHADHSKAKRTFDIKTSMPLDKGLTIMAEWARKVGIRKSKKFKEIEINEKLPAIWLED
jgi:UDP-glucose 4-epimerase